MSSASWSALERGAPAGRPARQPGQGGAGGGLRREGWRALKTRAGSIAVFGRKLDVTLPGRAVRQWTAASGHDDSAPHSRYPGRDGFPGLYLARYRNRRDQLPGAEFPAASPGARDAGIPFYIETGMRRIAAITRCCCARIPRRAKSAPCASFPLRIPKTRPPIRIALPGMCYRYEQITARSEVQFYQVEGLAVGENITYGDLKGTLADFARRMFGPQARMRFRASLLPVHRTFGGGGRRVLRLRRQGLRRLQEFRLAGNFRLRHGAPGRAAERRLRPAAYTGFAFGMGPQRHHHAAAPYERHPLFLGKRYSFPGAVLAAENRE